MPHKPLLLLIVFLMLWIDTLNPTYSASFSVAVAPPRFELKSKPGKVIRELITIVNTDQTGHQFEIKTADWDLDKAGSVILHPSDTLQANSCRPWTKIERRLLKVAAKSSKRYRFEVHIPQDAAAGECRFAVLIGSSPKTGRYQDSIIQMPIAGQIAIIVYVGIGDAQPKLEFQGAQVVNQQGRRFPALRFHNAGNAHGRPFGIITAVDSGKTKTELNPLPIPILPGETRDVILTLAQPLETGVAAKDFTYPLHLKGIIEFDGGRSKIDTEIH